ncbi:MAG: hypothetical protein KKB82_08735 [Candidatus Omnitrophica bacterium]|nr:hypothetical protein [Candidatus Omnitrophota bacterium]MBU1925987.1 hypothetical protein [Candidatus Omnitrophota bacterium]
METPNPRSKNELVQAQKEILAFLNGKPDKRATTKEVIENIKCQSRILKDAIIYLNRNFYIDGPILTEFMIKRGGDDSFRMAFTLTEQGQVKYIDMVKEEKKNRS